MDLLPTQTGQRQQSAVAANATAARNIAADFQMFLDLLTAQLKNQDPLNPMDSTEFATQLATFSGVEQQVRTNELLVDLQDGFATMALGDLAGWIGMEGRAARPLPYDGAPVSVAGTPNPLADRMELVVRDTRGTVVQRVQIPFDDAPVDWTGRVQGEPDLAAGTYTLAVQNWSGETQLDEQPAMILSRITEAQVIDGAVWLTMADGARVAASEIRGLRP